MTTERPFSSELGHQTPAVVQNDIRARAARVTALAAIVQRLEATVQPVTERVQQDARTSPRPQWASAWRAAWPRGTHAGGVPVEEVDVVCPVKPERCRHCQQPMQGEDAQSQRHQMTEIPPVEPVVTAYQLHQLVCPACGEVTRAELPPGVPRGEFGPRVQAITALCTGAYHLSKRTTQNVLADLFGVALGLGSIANLEQATAQAVAEPVAAARAYVQA